MKSVSLPDDPTGWAGNAVDKFVADKLREKKLRPVKEADKRTLIRRATFDLIGLPPTPEEIDAFIADNSPDAYSKLIDRLLASPHYGERWGRHWLDVAHYADTAGDNSDCPIPEMYRYRDYVIDSYNADKPYDEFIAEQLAGDLLQKDRTGGDLSQRLIATGFIGLARRFGTVAYQYRHMEIGDLIDCTGKSILGLTMGCARCHDHKFDPMTAEDYYALYGIFESTKYSFSGSEGTKDRQNLVSLVYSRETYAELKKEYDGKMNPLRDKYFNAETNSPKGMRIAEVRKTILSLEKQRDQAKAGDKDLKEIEEQLENATKERDELSADIAKDQKDYLEQIAAIDNRYEALLKTVAYAAVEGKPTDVPLQEMGDPQQPGEVVKRGMPKFLCGDEVVEIPGNSSGRLEFARWLTQPGTIAGGMTARVMVNRIWQHHFGRGVVGTPSNFGLNGEAPTHPELLEWLAGQFVDRGWSVKAVHRLIMLSKTYQLAACHDSDNASIDPANTWLWRFNRTRFEAEAIRDAMLAVSGNLKRDRPGPHPFPPPTEWRYSQHNPFKAVYPSQHRSVYLMTQRNERHPYLMIFDGADPNLSVGSRTSSIVPQQALYLMNNPFVREQAQGFAQRLIDGSKDAEERIKRAHELAWGRLPTAAEIERASEYVNSYRQQLELDGASPDNQEIEAWTSYAHLMLTANEFLYVE